MFSWRSPPGPRALERLEALPVVEQVTRALKFATRSLIVAPAADAPSYLAQLSNAHATWRNAQGAARDAVAELAIAAIRLRKAD
jgi:hypothetical protein